MSQQLQSLLKEHEPTTPAVGDDEQNKDSIVWVTAVQAHINDIAVLLSVDEVLSSKCLRVTVFEPLKVTVA